MTIVAENETKPSGLAGRALRWWLGELSGLADEVRLRSDLARRGALFIEAGERYWLLRRRDRPAGQIDLALLSPAEAAAAVAQLAGGRGPIVVEIPQERVLQKRLALPAAAEAALGQVLAYEIGRHFPFPAERVHFCHRVLASAGGSGGTITVEVVAVAREVVAEIAALLRAAGLTARALALPGADAPLFLPGRLAAPPRRTARLDRALLLELLVLGAAALASPIVRDRIALADLERATAAIAPRADAVLAARKAARRAEERAAEPLRLQRQRPPLVAVLADLTKAVPDGSWLKSLNISGQDVVISGLSPSAAAVALALEASHRFANVRFQSPIMRDPRTGLEQFQLSAALAEPKP